MWRTGQASGVPTEDTWPNDEDFRSERTPLPPLFRVSPNVRFRKQDTP